MLRLSAHDDNLSALLFSDGAVGSLPSHVQRACAAAPTQVAVRDMLVRSLSVTRCPLQVVTLCGVGLTDNHLQPLIRTIRHLPKLKSLDLRYNSLAPPSVRALAKVAEEEWRRRGGGSTAAAPPPLDLKLTDQLPPWPRVDRRDPYQSSRGTDRYALSTTLLLLWAAPRPPRTRGVAAIPPSSCPVP